MTGLTYQQREIIAQCSRDEASRIQLEQLFHAQQATPYQSIVECQTELICRYRPDLTLTYVNEAYCQFVGLPATELTGHSFLKIVDEGWHEAVRRDFMAYNRNPRMIFNEHISKRHDGAMRWMQWVRYPIFGEGDALVEIQAVGRDVTNHYGEDSLGNGEARYRRLIEGSPDGILITSQTVIRYVNRALVKMLETHDTAYLLDKTLFDIVHPDYHAVMEARITSLGHDSEAVNKRQEQFIKRDGSPIDVEITITPIDLDGTPASLIYVRDITRSKQTESTLHDFQEYLKTLHSLTSQLSKSDSFDTFCKAAVEKGRAQLGFDRLGLWFLSDDRMHVQGAFGTDENGQTIDERGATHPVDDKLRTNLFADGNTIGFWENSNLLDSDNAVVGKGWNAIAPLWDGDQILGYLSADNLLHQEPASPQQLELLMHYGSTLGHLATRVRTEDILHSYQDNLKVLHKLGIDLSKADSVDELCRQAVAEGRVRLGFDRLSLWFLNEDHTQMTGSYGIDTAGQVTDERHCQHPVGEKYLSSVFTTDKSLVVNEKADLLDGQGNVVGQGWSVMAALRNGDEVIGYMSADNLLRQQPLSPQQQELMTLYGSTLGHLATRIRTQETLVRQQEAEKQFQEQLKQLNEISIELAQCETFDDLCQQAIVIGRQRMGFDRMSLWFIKQDEPEIIHGTYGISEAGQIRAEWHTQRRIADLMGSPTHRVLTNQTLAEIAEDHELLNDRQEEVGRGWLAVTALHDGQQATGCLYADNFFKRQPFDQNQVELLRLYGSTLGHLAKRKWIEDNLRRSEERYRTIFEGASIGICLASKNGNPVSSNPAYAEMLGYTADELRQMTFTEFTHPDDRQRNLDLFQRLIVGELEHYQLEKRYIRKDGSSMWARIDAAQFPGTVADEPLTIALVQDINEQKQAVLALQSSEERFRAIFEGSLIGITVVNRQGRSVSFNPAYAAMVGYTPEELHETPLVEFTHPDDQQKSTELFEAVFVGDIAHRQFETRYLHKGGDVVWVRMNISPFPVADQSEKLMIAIAEDISEIKNAETNLRESEARNRALLAAIPDLIFVQDGDGMIVDYHMPAHEDLFALPESFLAQHLNDVLPEEANSLIQPAFKAAVSSGDMQIIEYPLSDGDKIEFFEARMIAYSNDRVLSMVRDITERKRIEQQNLELALQHERINIIADFIRDASHEFRTPLSVINSQVYLAMHLDDAEARRTQLAGIQEQSEVILKLVESLVTMSRLDSDMSVKYMPVGIGDILRAIYIGFQRRAAGNEITLLLEQDDDLPWVPGDNDDLYRAFYNVVDNAMRYTPAKGTITIRARRVSDDRFQVSVTDTGSGIEDADMPHIFERFFRGDRAHSTPGFGLGLPMTRRIIERHDGHVEVESEPGVGSTFSIYLPLRQSHFDAETIAQSSIT